MSEKPLEFDETPIFRSETCSVATVRRVAAMLDLGQEEFQEGVPLPRGWQFILMAADSRRSRIRPDGFPGLGVPMPELGLPSLLLGGRSVQYHRDILIGDNLTRRSRIQKVVQKVSQNGPMAIVTIEHELCSTGTSVPSLVENQTYILMGGDPTKRSIEGAAMEPPAGAIRVVPDDLLLFQYSALGFNSHKIHIDRSYAREKEGFPDLVVNGGLATLLMTEHFRHHCQEEIGRFTTKHLSPLFCGRPIFVTADKTDDGWQLCLVDERGTKAVEMVIRRSDNQPHAQ